MNQKQVIESIEREKIVVIMRGFSGDELFKTVDALYRGGIRCLEVTFDARGQISDEQTAEYIRTLTKSFPDMIIGAGTVLTEKQVELTAKAGGQFIISPDTNPAIVKKTKNCGLVSIPGAFTPSECVLAHNAGADFVKLFPISNMGISYLQALKAPLSHIRFLAVGGVTISNLRTFLNAGALGVGIASGIADPKLATEGKFEEITLLAKEFVAAAQE